MRTRIRLAAVAVAAAAATMTVAPVAFASDDQVAFGNIVANAQAGRIVSDTQDPDVPRARNIVVYSPSMDRNIPVRVLTPADTSTARPVIYQLPGAGGGEDLATWELQTDILNFYSDKNVWVVTPEKGQFSYYTDWNEPQPQITGTGTNGEQKWETFLTRELPEAIEPLLGTNGPRGVTGFSMSANSALLFAQHNPGMYQGVASFSGCVSNQGFLEEEALRQVLMRGSATPEAMWGPIGGERWVSNNALANADKLRGTELFITNGSGLWGVYDDPAQNHRLTQEWIDANMPGYSAEELTQAQQLTGVGIELATNICTHDLEAKLTTLGIPAQFDFRPTGTHSWGYWQDDMHNAWPMYERAFGDSLH